MQETNNLLSSIPQDLYMRLSHRSLSFARHELRREPYFDYSIFNIQHRSSLRSNLQEALATLPILQSPTRRIQILVDGGNPIPIPLADFKEEDCKKIYNYAVDNTDNHEVFYDVIATAGIVLLFSVEKNVCKSIEDTFNTEVHYLSALTPVLKHFTNRNVSTDQPLHLFLYLHESKLDIVLLNENRLIAINSYFVQNETDIAYYALGLLRNFVADIEETVVHIVADDAIQRESASTELKKYLSKIYTIHPAAEFNRHPIATTEGITYDFINLLLP